MPAVKQLTPETPARVVTRNSIRAQLAVLQANKNKNAKDLSDMIDLIIQLFEGLLDTEV